MEFRIADTFTDNLTRLTSDEQKAVKMTAFDLQLNPASPWPELSPLECRHATGFSPVLPKTTRELPTSPRLE